MSRYVKAVYDFPTTEAGEISLKVGDVVRVVKQVDSNWLQVSDVISDVIIVSMFKLHF